MKSSKTMKPLRGRKKKCWSVGAPYQARTIDAVCRLQRDNLQFPEHWMSVQGKSVHIAEQTLGESAKYIMTIPRKDFLQMVRWYLRPQRLRYLKDAK